MNEIKQVKALLESKNTEKEKIIKEIYDIQSTLCKQIKSYVFEEERNNILSNHNHYKDNHVLEYSSDYYYDTDWYKTTYYKRNPTDKFGKLLPYEGPNISLTILCESCDININAYYKIDDEIFIDKLMKEKVDDYILNLTYNKIISE